MLTKTILENGLIFGNRLLDISLISCLLAQIYKVFTPLLKGQKIQWMKIIQTGGMPSSHASTVTTLTTGLLFLEGPHSVSFAISFVFAIIVIYDATGIRRQAGEHAKALNKIFNEKKSQSNEEVIKQFKEFLGHTPYEVFWGIILGIVVAYVFKGYILGI